MYLFPGTQIRAQSQSSREESAIFGEESPMQTNKYKTFGLIMYVANVIHKMQYTKYNGELQAKDLHQASLEKWGKASQKRLLRYIFIKWINLEVEHYLSPQ